MNQKQSETSCVCQLRRNVKIECVQVFGRLVIERKRSDIQKILQRFLKGENLPKRLFTFLQRIQLIERRNLTDKGKKVLDTGTLPTEERGLYYVWYTCDDPLFKTRPLLIQRETSYFEPNIKRYQSLQAEYSKYAVDEACLVQIWNEHDSGKGAIENVVIGSFTPEKVGESVFLDSLKLDWKLSAKDSNIQLKGHLKIGGRTNNGQFKLGVKNHHLSLPSKEKKEHWNSIMQSISDSVGGSWNKEHQRIQIDLNKIDDSSLRQKAIVDFMWSRWQRTVITSIGEFDSTIHNMPFIPYEKDVEEWQESWVQQHYQSNYQVASSSRKDQALWLSHPALQSFSMQMWSVEEMLQRMRKRQTTAFWHIATMQDLIPANVKVKRNSWALQAGSTLSKRQFWERLSCEHEIIGLVVADRYARNYQEQLDHLLSYCSSDVEVDIWSLEEPNRSWVWHKTERIAETHSRYWIIKTKEREYCWVVDNSLSFLDTIADPENMQVKGGTHWTPILRKDLPSYLKEVQQGEAI